jgi:S1-C subfamily serine protease
MVSSGLLRMSKIGAVVAAALVAASATASASTSTANAVRASTSNGVVVVKVQLAYSRGTAAGTGIVLKSSGQVLTNNHVIRGASSIRVTVPSSGKTYTAKVTGYSVSGDVALLTLKNASGLKTAKTGNSNTLGVGDGVTAVGNSGGTGKLTTKTGKVTGIGQSITVNDQGNPVTLSGLIETTAPLEPGDSGGAMLSGGRVIGMNAAASGTYVFSDTSSEGYAIPINRALQIVSKIRSGQSSATVHIGPTAFLGVSLAPERYYGDNLTGALVEGVASGSPAAKAGLGPNDLIIAFAGKRVRSSDDLKKLVLLSKPGRTVRITWIDPYSGKTSANVRLVAGPPQ